MLLQEFVFLTFWLWEFMGRLHPLVVHFPIGLLIIASCIELYAWKKGTESYKGSIKLILAAGALTGIASIVFGLLLKEQNDYDGTTILIHQWSGIAATFFAITTLYFFRRAENNAGKSRLFLFRASLFLSSILVSVAGHYGAMLTHGSDFLTEVLPGAIDGEFGGQPDFDLASFDADRNASTLNETQIANLNLAVRSIFAHNCYKCHGAEKTKGQLRLDKKELVMRGGKSGEIISVGHPENSELIRRLLLPREDEESMPQKGKSLTRTELETLELWIKLGARWPADLKEKSIYRVAALEPRTPSLPNGTEEFNNPIDKFVADYFKDKNISRPTVVDDRLFIRRVYLDIIGLLPPPEKVAAFTQNKNPRKREALVEELLNRNDDYAQHWLSFWNDALRNDYTGTGYITGGRFAISDWLYEALQKNKPYDQFVSELISPNKKSEGFIRGIKWRGTVNASQRVEMQAAQNVGQVFLGLNLKCASCHDSFISDLKLTDAYAFANIFSDTTLEINRCDKPTGKMAGTRIIFSELGELDSSLRVEDKLKQLAQYLTAPKNGRLYRTIVNRMWAQLLGRGIVEPVDLMDNEPWSQDLLDWLAVDFVENGKDIKRLLYMITTSTTYQLPSVGMKDESDLLAKNYMFRGSLRRRLSAEQFADAISIIVGPVYPDTLRAFNPFDNSKGSTVFARASLVKNDPFLTALGRPSRENVSTSRSSQANLLQTLELTNGAKFNSVLESGSKKWSDRFKNSEDLVVELYQAALSRKPEPRELEIALKRLESIPKTEDVQDLLWSIFLLPEFQLIY